MGTPIWSNECGTEPTSIHRSGPFFRAEVPFDKGVMDLPGVDFKLSMMKVAGLRYATDKALQAIQQALTKPSAAPVLPTSLPSSAEPAADLLSFLQNLDLEKYSAVFAAEEIDLEARRLP